MEDKVLQDTIDKIKKILNNIESINIFGDTFTEAGRKRNQRKINQGYDDLFELHKHLRFIQKKRERDLK